MELGQFCEESPFPQQVFKHFLSMDGLYLDIVSCTTMF